MSIQYKNAGVNIDAGYEAVSRIKKHIERTRTPGVIGGLGGFGGLFDFSQIKMDEPVLVSGTDGVGTKLMLAFETGRHDTIGIDAVAMCVNDVLTVGAAPLFFLDYIACGKLVPALVEEIVAGVSEGCVRAGCALIGGETAEMPGMYKEGEYDIAGFCVGAVEKKKMITGEGIKAGDLLVGLASSGAHSNGFSLIRKIIADNGLNLNETYPGFERSLEDELLTPTRIYTGAVGELCSAFEVKGMAHITGGGFIENIPRMLPNGLGAVIDMAAWEIPPVFQFLQKQGNVPREEMFGLFNMGIGFAAVIGAGDAGKLPGLREKALVIGQIIEGGGVMFR